MGRKARQLLNKKQVCEIFGISKRTLDRWRPTLRVKYGLKEVQLGDPQSGLARVKFSAESVNRAYDKMIESGEFVLHKTESKNGERK